MPKRTRRQSLLRCRKLWQCLADHPEFELKEQAYTHLDLEMNDHSECPACEFNQTHKINGSTLYCCGDCIIKWPNSSCVLDSPYLKWSRATTDNNRRTYALEVVALCDAALSALPPIRSRKK